MWHCHKNETVRNRNFLIFHFWGKNEYMLLTCILVFKLALKVHNELEYGFLNFVKTSEFWNYVRTTKFVRTTFCSDRCKFANYKVTQLQFEPWRVNIYHKWAYFAAIGAKLQRSVQLRSHSVAIWTLKSQHLP